VFVGFMALLEGMRHHEAVGLIRRDRGQAGVTMSTNVSAQARIPDDVAAIEFEGLSKSYGSGVLALDSLTLSVPRGEIFGFLGPNGAGKSTTLRLMLDLLRPTSGSVRIFGQDCNDGASNVRSRVGYLPGDLTVYPNMTVRAAIDLFSELRPGAIRPGFVDDLCERLMLDPTKRNRELSHGNRQKVGVVLAVMAEAELIILDEPTNALDPLIQREVLEILREVRERGSTVFFSSHNLPEVERICDRVGMIRQGRLVAVERVEEVVSQRLTALVVGFDSPVAEGVFAGLDGVTETFRNNGGREVHLEVSGEVDALVKLLAQHRVLTLESAPPSLEEAFMSLYEGGRPAQPESQEQNDASPT
jgi:ABC-2 type transport system ATP-binding protein